MKTKAHQWLIKGKWALPGLNSSLASLILISVSAATVSFSLTSAAVTLVVASTWMRDSSSTRDPYQNGHTCSNTLYTMYSKTYILSSHSKRPQIGFQDRSSLNAGQKYCRMLQESILQYFRPSLSYHLSLRPLFCLFLSGHFTQVLL